MNAEQANAWAMSLNPGDKVVRTTYWDDTPEAVLTVDHITPTGRIATDQGTYMLRKWSGRYLGVGAARNEIIPATPETIAAAEEFQRKERERERDAAYEAIKELIEEEDLPVAICKEICENHDGMCCERAQIGIWDTCRGFKPRGQKEE